MSKTLGQIAAEAYETGDHNGQPADYDSLWDGADPDWKRRWELAASAVALECHNRIDRDAEEGK